MRFSLLTLLALVFIISGVLLAVGLPVYGMIQAFDETASEGSTSSPGAAVRPYLQTGLWGLVPIALGILFLILRLRQRGQERVQSD